MPQLPKHELLISKIFDLHVFYDHCFMREFNANWMTYRLLFLVQLLDEINLQYMAVFEKVSCSFCNPFKLVKVLHEFKKFVLLRLCTDAPNEADFLIVSRKTEEVCHSAFLSFVWILLDPVKLFRIVSFSPRFCSLRIFYPILMFVYKSFLRY